ncbi:glutathionylspermidine synthase family protein [Vibrio alginolyticus]|uniref:glutathionylspermidine synthase family protein n=3 Tax=Vibrionaceae TaxID=641 RepID=UPI0028FC1813|nr:glutathionylspermidine synthase family protein [Vibrio alginolyticus]WNW08277.1 glutathionylspermidine synthase family protein [Vibrio alginolyticus]
MHTNMRKILLPVTPDYFALEAECPRTSAIALIHGGNTSLTPLEDEFVFPENKDAQTPFYRFTREEVKAINIASEQVYNLLVNSLDFLFSEAYKSLIPTFYGREFIEQFPEFVEYAIHTYEQNHEAIYGRFDIAYDFENGKVLKFYEGNLDTPTMYYDSVIMQDHLVTKLDQANDQYNLHYENLTKTLDRVIGKSPKRVAFLCDTKLTEDCITTELLFHAFNEQTEHLVQFSDINRLVYDFSLNRSTWLLDDLELDYIFALYPWEDMVRDLYAETSNPLLEWHKWSNKTRFMEPAWRWFVSNKGVWAWLTYLKDVLAKEDRVIEAFVTANAEAWQYVIPSFMEKPPHLSHYVKKPLQGRMSNNIEFYHDDKLVHETSGFYAEDDFIYQELCPTTSADQGETKAIVCSWLAPWVDGEALDMESSGIAVREFTGEVLQLHKERFMPHIVE